MKNHFNMPNNKISSELFFKPEIIIKLLRIKMYSLMNLKIASRKEIMNAFFVFNVIDIKILYKI